MKNKMNDISTEDKKDSQVVASKPKRRFNAKKLWVILLGVLIVVIAGGAVVYALLTYKKQQSQSVCTSGGSNSLARQAATVFNPADYKKLKTVTDTIQTKKGYEEDPNCLLPIVMYHVYLQSEKNAKDNLAKLEKVYDPKVGFDPAYDLWVENIESVRSRVDTVSKQSQEIKKNRINVRR